jgi:hypothetical protein
LYLEVVISKFLNDKDKGDIAEGIVLDILAEEYPKKKFKRVTGKNSDWDIIEDTRSRGKLTIEVKFDIKAYDTGNLCFEFTNGLKRTGVCVSKAQEIWYVLRTKKKDEFQIFRFRTADLLQYLLFNTLLNPNKQRVVFGGDRKSFGLIIVPIPTVENDIDSIGDVSTWQVKRN